MITVVGYYDDNQMMLFAGNHTGVLAVRGYRPDGVWQFDLGLIHGMFIGGHNMDNTGTMDKEYVDGLRDYVLEARTYGLTEPWCIGYVTAFYNTGLITRHECQDILVMITDMYRNI